jgi:undecaprenyl-diphosphatase
MEQLIKTIVLGIIQGVTEWLPISSTGHLKLTEYFLDLKVPILFDVILHIGTLIVTLFFFRKDIKNMLSALISLDFKTENGKLIPVIIAGTMPTALIGLVFGDIIENTFQSMLPIAMAFIICGVMLYISKFGKEEKDDIGYLAAVLIGTAQGIAIIPGVSRSGTTIATALLLGIKREKTFKFSFLLSIPAIIGALGLTINKQFDKLATADLGWIEILAGMTVAMLVGYLALKLLWKILTKKKLHIFALYCWLLGAALIILGLGVF